VRPVFGTADPVVIYPASGTGAWEAALVNTLSPGDKVLFFETGHFAMLWEHMAGALGLDVEVVPGDWRHGVDPAAVQERLAADTAREVKAVCVVHNEWRVDVTVSGSQKGLMLPPGLSFNAVSAKAREASASAQLRRSFWDWEPILKANQHGFWPYTPGTNLLYGLDVALDMLYAEGLENVFARHQRHAAATRAAVREWGLELLCLDEREYSGSLTAILVPEGSDADELRRIILERFDMSLGAGLTRLAGKVFRIGHLGDFNDLTLAGTLSGVQMGLHLAGIPVKGSGVDAALELLRQPASGA
jgi:alanine-glyoxylate transaminase/serine-glyoxylate transaminase/serine-pyruvate transaminase